jgi:hypothetical protein
MFSLLFNISKYIATCKVLRVTTLTGLVQMIRFIGTSITLSLNYN